LRLLLYYSAVSAVVSPRPFSAASYLAKRFWKRRRSLSSLSLFVR